MNDAMSTSGSGMFFQADKDPGVKRHCTILATVVSSNSPEKTKLKGLILGLTATLKSVPSGTGYGTQPSTEKC